MQTLIGRWYIMGRNVWVKSRRSERNNQYCEVEQRNEKLRDGKIVE